MRVWVLALGLLMAFPAVAQHAHETSDRVFIAHDVAPDGRTYVGNPVRFTVVAHGGDGIPDFHQDIPIRIRMANVTLLETTVVSGHDYDGMASVDVAFPVPGPYTVEALDSAGAVLASFSGYVEARPPSGDVAFDADKLPLQWTAGTPNCVSFEQQRNQTRLTHVDTRLEITRNGRTMLDTKLHAHDDRQSYCYTPFLPGNYQIRWLSYQAYPTATGNRFDAFVTVQNFTVLPGVPVPAPVPAAPTELNAVAVAGDGDLRLVGTFDPYTLVGPDTMIRLHGLVVNTTTLAAVQHVNFDVKLEGPEGVVFQSDSLHEYDGIYDLGVRNTLPGMYRATLGASYKSWSAQVELAYVVLPPVLPTNAGPASVTFTPPQSPAGQASLLHWAATTPGDRAFAHSELRVAILGQGPVPIYETKLHTHGDGTFDAWFNPPEVGIYQVRTDNFALLPEAATGQTLSFDWTATTGPALHQSTFAAVGDADLSAKSPGLPVALLGLALLAFALRRR